MPLRRAAMTVHAWQRFVSRWEGSRPPCFRRELLQIMALAQEEDLGYGNIQRMLNHHLTPARYFSHGKWRFVTNEDVTTILTIEHPYRKGKPKQEKQGKKRRRQKV